MKSLFHPGASLVERATTPAWGPYHDRVLAQALTAMAHGCGLPEQTQAFLALAAEVVDEYVRLVRPVAHAPAPCQQLPKDDPWARRDRIRLGMWVQCLQEGREWRGIVDDAYAFGPLPEDSAPSRRMPVGPPWLDVDIAARLMAGQERALSAAPCADSPEDFARQIVAAIDTSDLRARLAVVAEPMRPPEQMRGLLADVDLIAASLHAPVPDCPHPQIRPLAANPNDGICEDCGVVGFPMTPAAAGACPICGSYDPNCSEGHDMEKHPLANRYDIISQRT